MSNDHWMGMQQNYTPVTTLEDAIKAQVRRIDEELSRYSEERRQQLLVERARLLRAAEALGFLL